MKNFRLVRFYVLTSLVFFVLAVASLSYLQNRITVDNLLHTKEHAHVDLTRTFSNSLWPSFRGFVQSAAPLDRATLQARPELKELNRQVVAMLRGLSVLKVKVYAPNGNTVFSTQASQIGDDKSQNGGFLSAMGSKPVSELTHRDTFSAFEQTVEDKDVISSYVPIFEAGSDKPVGVFEIYSDVTDMLAEVEKTQYLVVGGVAALVLLLFLSQFFTIRHADKVMQQQEIDASKTKVQMAQQEKMASLGQMVAGVAHELNTPLAFSRSNIELAREALEELAPAMNWGHKLIEEIKDHQGRRHMKLSFSSPSLRQEADEYDPALMPEELVEVLQQTINGLEQMGELVRNLKDFTRLDRARVAHYDLNKGLDNVLYIARSVVHSTIQIDTDFDDNLPDISCLPSQINQVFINLVTNAAQAVDPENGHILVRSSVDGPRVRVDVEDNGSGISDADMKHIFDAFYTTKAAGEGTGLGLAIVKEIVDNHGGEITVSSAQGKGTVFSVWLPVQRIDDDLMAEAA